MAISRFEAEKFSGKNDFGLWRLKMRAMLVQQGLAEALRDRDAKEDPANPSEKETRSCHYCKKPDHLKKNFFSWKKKQAEQAATTDCVKEVEIPQALNVTEGIEEGPWIMDSGCSLHMCYVRHWFADLSESKGSVLLGNNQICKIEGIGSIMFKMHDGTRRLFTEVRYIPDIKRNLISLGMLEGKGCSFVSTGGIMKILKDGEVVMKAERKSSSLYYLVADVISGSANVVQKADLRQWHLRM